MRRAPGALKNEQEYRQENISQQICNELSMYIAALLRTDLTCLGIKVHEGTKYILPGNSFILIEHRPSMNTMINKICSEPVNVYYCMGSISDGTTKCKLHIMEAEDAQAFLPQYNTLVKTIRKSLYKKVHDVDWNAVKKHVKALAMFALGLKKLQGGKKIELSNDSIFRAINEMVDSHKGTLSDDGHQKVQDYVSRTTLHSWSTKLPANLLS